MPIAPAGPGTATGGNTGPGQTVASPGAAPAARTTTPAQPQAPHGTPHRTRPALRRPAQYRRVDADLSTSPNGTELWPKGTPFTSVIVRALPQGASGYVGVRIGSQTADAILLNSINDGFEGWVEDGGLYLSNAPVGQPDGPGQPYPPGSVLTLIIGMGGSVVKRS